MPLIIGIDPAKTRLAAVVWDGKHRFWLERRSMPSDLVWCCDIAERWVRNLIKKYRDMIPLEDIDGEVWVFVEGPVLAKGGPYATIVQAQVQGSILSGARKLTKKVVQVHNQTAKMRIVGYGNASKTDIKRCIKRLWPKLYVAAKGNQDLMDAAMIALYGKHIIRIRKRVEAGKWLSRSRSSSSETVHRTRPSARRSRIYKSFSPAIRR